jgi:subtilisin family serine protease
MKRILPALSFALLLLVLMTLPLAAARAQVVAPLPPAERAVLPAPIEASQPTTLTTAADWANPALLARMEPALLKALAAAVPGARVPVIVELREQARPAENPAQAVSALRATAERSQRDLKAFVTQEQAAGRAAAVRSFWIFNGMALQAAPETAWALAARSDVALVRLDQKRRWVTEPPFAPGQALAPAGATGVEWGIQRIRADQVWTSLNVTGTGVVVGSLDTGVDFMHPALNGNYRGNLGKGVFYHLGNWFDATDGNSQYPTDGYGHGTHTMGTLAGSGGIGVAPGARWIAARIFDNQGFSQDSWIHAGFQWMLAPNGDPALAPDVLNNSWGNPDGSLTTFQADIARLQQAGMVVVFSAGNNGPLAASVDSPASLPGVLAVGATDDSDLVASFSSRGPSPWGEIKPLVAAPGVRVRSSIPGGAYAWADGTSMAAPHVSGIVALMRSIHPHLSITATVYALTSTVTPLGATRPNNNTGWGRVDALAAVQSVAGAGILTGQVVDASSRLPLNAAQLTAHNTDAGSDTPILTGPDGRYQTGLAAAPYILTARAFGYRMEVAPLITVITGQTTVRDFALTPLPVGVVRGVMTDTTTGRPVTVSVSALGTPVTQQGFGAYQLALPPGAYVLEARELGYRVITATVTVTAGQVVERDFGLIPAPRLLLVDAGARYYGGYPIYYRQALDDLGYVYEQRAIRDPVADTPTLDEMLKYDVVIWSSPDDSPGLIGAQNVITGYLSAGRGLILSGQDVAYWDGGGSGLFLAPYLQRYLKTAYVRDDAGSRSLVGAAGDVMDGLSFDIKGSGGANNQLWPDEIAVTDPDYAAPILNYRGDGLGGEKIGQCLPYRAVMLSFGYEAINDAASRRAVMARSLAYLTGPRPTEGVSLAPVSSSLQVGLPGSAVTFTVRVRNTGEAGQPVTFDATTLAGAWASTVTPAQFNLDPCTTETVTVTAVIPALAQPNTRADIVLSVRPQRMSLPAQTVTLTAKTPAPVLLVDHHRWYPVAQAYTQSLEQIGVPYDVWDVGTVGAPDAQNGPPLARLKWYPEVVWFTGYDWYRPLSTYDEAQLSAYLDAGGRLLLSSAFYLDNRGHSAFARDRLGVLDFTYGLTATQTLPAFANPLSKGLDPLRLNDPFPRAGFFTLDGGMTPDRQAATAWRGEHLRSQAISQDRPGNRLIFWNIPLEALPDAGRSRALQRAVGWLGPLGDSTASVEPPVVAAGQPVTLSFTVRNNAMATTADVTATLPPGFAADGAAIVTADPGETAAGMTAGNAPDVLLWRGTLAAGGAVTFTVPGRAAGPFGAGTPGRVIFHDERWRIDFDQPLSLRVDAPDLAASALMVGPVTSGGAAIVTMVGRNRGPQAAASAIITGVLPLSSRVIAGSVRMTGSGVLVVGEDRVTWRGALSSGGTVTITYDFTVPLTTRPLSLPVEMLAQDGQGGGWEWRAWAGVGPNRLYMPLVRKK